MFFILLRPISKKMFDKNYLLAAVRLTLPEDEILPGRNNDWTIVSNKYLMYECDSRWSHAEKYTKVPAKHNYAY